MRIYSKTLAIGGVLTLLLLGGSSSVSAVSTCPAGFTGPGSTNICTSVETFACTVSNTNQVTVTNQNAQGSVSGNASGNGAQSGTATNSNGTVFNVSVTNEGVCTAVRAVPATPVAESPTPSTPQAQVVATAEAPTVLANTGNETATWLPFIALGIVAVGAAAIRYAVIASK